MDAVGDTQDEKSSLPFKYLVPDPLKSELMGHHSVGKLAVYLAQAFHGICVVHVLGTPCRFQS